MDNDKIIIICCLLSFLGGCAVWHKILSAYISRHPRRPIDYVKACELIEELNSDKNKLQAVERLLTDSECCSEELQREIKCLWGAPWESEDEREHNKYTFRIDTNDNYFTHIARSERKKLKATIAQKIDDLISMRCRTVVTQTVTQTANKSIGGGVHNG